MTMYLVMFQIILVNQLFLKLPSDQIVTYTIDFLTFSIIN